MDTRKISRLVVSIFIYALLVACAPVPSPTPYLPPTPAARVTMPSLPSPTLLPPTPTIICTDNLTLLEDVTIPDNTIVEPGSTLDKQWRVQNAGSCNWNSSYRLRFLGGSLLGANEEQALYPARAGTEAVLRILFTAPTAPGQYVSLWQAYDQYGTAFGEIFQMTIIVQP
jgi:hypothetical protein